ncbi:hypothetical protein LI328DRAFT_87140 [Trichoderma asperelloides]|nr:hypothetical protein LI328DRAFT_87140 [Trichoderma asperelloides]
MLHLLVSFYPIVFLILLMIRSLNFFFFLTTFAVMQAASYCHSCCRYLPGISAILGACGGCSMLHRPHAKPEKHAHIDIGMLQHPYYFAQALLVQRGTCTTRCLHDKPDVRLNRPHSAKY